MLLYIVFFALLIYLVAKSFRKPERFPPGPPKLPIVGSMPYLSKTGSLLHVIKEAVEQYGPIVGIYLGSKPTIFVADYNMLKGK